jgi:hypothetical protein
MHQLDFAEAYPYKDDEAGIPIEIKLSYASTIGFKKKDF